MTGHGGGWRTWIIAAVAAVAVAAVPGDSLAAKKSKRKAKPSFFNSTEVRSKNMKPFKKWNGALKKFLEQKAKEEKGGCEANKFTICHYQEWMAYLDTLRDKTPLEQVYAVNKYMNTRRYITDPKNWGKKDYWATPVQFLIRFGDCEDYSIAKFMSLKILGFPETKMRVAAVKDLNLKVGHAVLVVFLDGKTYLLDNQIKKVVETKTVTHYEPVFSLNTDYWWRHRKPKKRKK